MAPTKRTRTRSGERTNTPVKRVKQQGFVSEVRESPLKAAFAVGGAVAAGLFLWSRRSSVSDRISDVRQKVDELRQDSGPAGSQNTSEGNEQIATPPARKRGRRSQAEIAQEALTLKQLGTVDGG